MAEKTHHIIMVMDSNVIFESKKYTKKECEEKVDTLIDSCSVNNSYLYLVDKNDTILNISSSNVLKSLMYITDKPHKNVDYF